MHTSAKFKGHAKKNSDEEDIRYSYPQRLYADIDGSSIRILLRDRIGPENKAG